MEKNEKDYEKKMIVIKVMGGLGNQLFQLAFGMGIAKKYKYKVKYDITYYDNIPENEKNKATRGRDECPVSAINLKDN